MKAMEYGQEQYGYAQDMSMVGAYGLTGAGMYGGQVQQVVVPGHSNVFVRNIPPEVDENALSQMFASYGFIEHTRLVKNKNPSANNYGFVKFQSLEQAQLAISSMNNAQVGNSFLEVKFASQDMKETGGGVSVVSSDAPYQGTPSDNLYVRNLPQNYEDSDLRSLFSMYGSVQEVRMLHPGDAARQGSALVRMGTQDEAKRTIDNLHGKPPPGGVQNLVIRYADTDEEKVRRRNTSQPQTVNGTNRYAPYSTANRQPQGQPQMQQQPQAMMQTVQPMQQQPGTFPAPGAYDATQAQFGYAPQQPPVMTYDQFFQPTPGGAVQGNNFMMAAPAQPQPAPQPVGPSSIYVKNIPHTEVSECELFLYRKFSPLGCITSVYIMQDKETGNARGVGFVNFTESSSAQNAVQSMNGQKFDDKVLGVALQNSRKQKMM